jgi:ABC-type multidrug transport system fused ATPase/permease subunit
VLYNVRYSKPDVTMDEVYAACKSAGIHKTIMERADGYQTRVGPNGAYVAP